MAWLRVAKGHFLIRLQWSPANKSRNASESPSFADLASLVIWVFFESQTKYLHAQHRQNNRHLCDSRTTPYVWSWWTFVQSTSTLRPAFSRIRTQAWPRSQRDHDQAAKLAEMWRCTHRHGQLRLTLLVDLMDDREQTPEPRLKPQPVARWSLDETEVHLPKPDWHVGVHC